MHDCVFADLLCEKSERKGLKEGYECRCVCADLGICAPDSRECVCGLVRGHVTTESQYSQGKREGVSISDFTPLILSLSLSSERKNPGNRITNVPREMHAQKFSA